MYYFTDLYKLLQYNTMKYNAQQNLEHHVKWTT